MHWPVAAKNSRTVYLKLALSVAKEDGYLNINGTFVLIKEKFQ